MPQASRRDRLRSDRRRVPRGGRRATDRPGAHPAILVVEDDRAIQQTLADYLRRFGFRVECFEDGLSASRLTPEFRPDLIVSDLDLPLMSGYELLTSLAGNPRTRRIPVVVFTGDANAEPRVRRLGCAAFVTKPAMPQVLLERIREVFRIRPPRRGRTSGSAEQSSSC